MRKTYWLYLEPYVYINKIKNNILIYNTYNGKKLEYMNNLKINRIINRLISKKNLMVIKINDAEKNDQEIKKFLKEIRKYYFGDYINMSPNLHYSSKPIQIMPILNLYSNLHINNVQSHFALGRNILKTLKECTLYINNKCDAPVSNLFKEAYKQFLFSYIADKEIELHLNHIKKLFDDLISSSLIRINIIGGNIFKYSNFKELYLFLNKLPSIKRFYCHYSDFSGNNINSQWQSNIGFLTSKKPKNNLYLCVLVDLPIRNDQFKYALDIIHKLNFNFEFVFVIQDNNDLNCSNSIVSTFNISNYNYQPFFNGNNIAFFKKHVFIKKKDLFNTVIDQKEIFRRSILNSSNFGKITILCDGKIYANLNNRCLGDIKKDSIYSIIYKEINSGKSWRLSRKNISPCRKCIYNIICPPVSNYEYVIKQHNLCHVYKNEKK